MKFNTTSIGGGIKRDITIVTTAQLSLGTSNFRKETQQIVDGKAQRDHRSRVTTIYQFVEMFVLV